MSEEKNAETQKFLFDLLAEVGIIRTALEISNYGNALDRARQLHERLDEIFHAPFKSDKTDKGD